jgi:hypothetical protein
MRHSDIKKLKLFDFERLIKRNSSTVKAQDLVRLNETPYEDEMPEMNSYSVTKPNFFIKSAVINLRRIQKIFNGQENE